MGFMNFNNMDYSFFDLYVDDYEYEEVAKTLTVNCKYRGEENKKIAFFQRVGGSCRPLVSYVREHILFSIFALIFVF